MTVSRKCWMQEISSSMEMSIDTSLVAGDAERVVAAPGLGAAVRHLRVANQHAGHAAERLASAGEMASALLGLVRCA